MSTVVYVGNISFDTAAESLQQFIEQQMIGSPVNVDLKIGPNGRSKGWALIDCFSPDVAATCVSYLGGLELDGRALRVNIDGDRPAQQQRAPRGGGGGGGGGGASSAPQRQAREPVVAEPSNRVYVGSLPWAVQDADLFKIFELYGPVSASVAIGHDDRSRGYGIVEFGTTADATQAIAGTNGMEVDGRFLVVRFDAGQPSRKGGGGGGGFQDGAACTGTSIYVRNIPHDMSWQGLKDLFSDLVPEFAQAKFGSGWGTVRFADAATATTAIERYNGFQVAGNFEPLEVRLDTRA